MALGLLLALSPAGFPRLQGAPAAPGAPAGKGVQNADPVVVQQNVLRFSDEFISRVDLGIDNLRRDDAPFDPAEALRWKIALTTGICSIASGSNAISNLLDLTVLVSVTRAAVEEQWQPKVFGASAQPLLESCRNSEADVWLLTGGILTAEQQTELHEAIDLWRRQNPLSENILAARALGFASQVGEAKGSRKKNNSVFSLLRLDPLAGMDPAVREIAQTRLLAERALYVTQKMPQLLRWQLELLTNNTLDSPTVQQLVTNTTQLTAAVDRVSQVAEQLPGQVDKQREEVFKALEAQEKQLTPLVSEVRQTLGTGKDLSASLNTTITSVDALMKRFGVGEPPPPGPKPPPGEPFHIEDYTRTAAQLEATARQLTELVRALDQATAPAKLGQLSAQVAPAVQQAQASGKALVDYAFWRALLFVAAVLAAALAYRVLAVRITRAGARSSQS